MSFSGPQYSCNLHKCYRKYSFDEILSLRSIYVFLQVSRSTNIYQNAFNTFYNYLLYVVVVEDLVSKGDFWGKNTKG